jgi:hypothetical protein
MFWPPLAPILLLPKPSLGGLDDLGGVETPAVVAAGVEEGAADEGAPTPIAGDGTVDAALRRCCSASPREEVMGVVFGAGVVPALRRPAASRPAGAGEGVFGGGVGVGVGTGTGAKVTPTPEAVKPTCVRLSDESGVLGVITTSGGGARD